MAKKTKITLICLKQQFGIQMHKVLLLEDNETVQKYVKNRIEEEIHADVVVCETLKEALANLETDNFAMALIDLTLPDASGLDVVEALETYEMPKVVLTATYDEDMRQEILQHNVMDYIIKDSQGSIDYTIRLIQFVMLNRDNAILIVDDSPTSRLHIVSSIEGLPLQIFEASSGVEALLILKENPQIKLAIIDMYMPEMNGVELLGKIRIHHKLNDFAVIGISGTQGSDTTLKFLKNGANDFVTKPIVPEEIFIRVISNIEMIDYIKIAKDSAVRDYLTGLYNRRYFFDAGTTLYENAKRKHLSIVIAMLDIDYFKKVNDRYGHHAGDLALKAMAEVLQTNVRKSDIVARYGGEEFCILLSNTSLEHAKMVMEKVRLAVSEIIVKHQKIQFSFTVSIGMTDTLAHSLDEMINLADMALYRAKEEGRNRIVI